MKINYLQQKIRYLTNEKGERTDVLIPLEVWKNLLELLPDRLEDEDSKEAILTDLKEALLDAQKGKTFPLEELWEGIDT